MKPMKYLNMTQEQIDGLTNNQKQFPKIRMVGDVPVLFGPKKSGVHTCISFSGSPKGFYSNLNESFGRNILTFIKTKIDNHPETKEIFVTYEKLF